MRLIFGKICVASACSCVTQLQNMDILERFFVDGIDLYNVGRAKDYHYPVRLQSGILCSLSIELPITLVKIHENIFIALEWLLSQIFGEDKVLNGAGSLPIFPPASSDPLVTFINVMKYLVLNPSVLVFFIWTAIVDKVSIIKNLILGSRFSDHFHSRDVLE